MSRSPRLSRAQLLAAIVVPALLGGTLGATFRSLRVGLAIVLGPLSGAALYPGHSGRLDFSLSILPWSLALVILGVWPQFALAPTARWRNVVRWLGWMLALLGWFGGAVVSDAQALE